MYIAQNINNYDKGSNMSDNLLMTLTKNKYNVLLSSGWCKSPNKYQKEVLALRAQVEDLKKKKDSYHIVKMNWKKGSKQPQNHQDIQ